MKINRCSIYSKFISQIALLCGGLSCAAASSYSWQAWDYPFSSRATTASSAGTVILNVSGPSTQVVDLPVQFVSDLTPSPSAGPQHTSNAAEDWNFYLDFYSFTTTQGVVLGLGNIGAGSTYMVSAYGPLGVPMPLSGFSVVGSFDYHWNSLSGILFNDDLSLNLATGNLTRTTVPGGNDSNSDMLILTLPDGVETIVVSTVSPGIGDSINVMIGSVPEPSTACLGLVAIGLLTGRRRTRS